MAAARSWAVMAMAAPFLTALVVLALSSPGRAFLHDVVTCEWKVSSSTQALVIMIPIVLALAITLTFVTAAVQRQGMPWSARCLWALCLLLGSPVTIPLYWFLYLRDQ